MKTIKDIKYEDNEEDGFTVIKKEHLENIEDMKRKSEDEFTPEAAVKKQCSNTTENVTDIEEENVTHEQTTTPEVQTEAFSDNNGGEAAPTVTEIVEHNVRETTVTQPHASGSQGQVDIQQPSTSSSSRTNYESKQSKKKQKKKKNGLINSLWTVTELEGHEDLVLDIDISDQDDNLAVSASRDTTVKIWNTETGHLVQSLRGHSGAVTGAKFLDNLHHKISDSNERLVVTAGLDCSLRVWGVTSGQCLRSHYTYNGVTRLEILHQHCASVTATDGGKLGN